MKIMIVVGIPLVLLDTASAQTKTVVDARMGVQGDKATYHLVEAFQVRGRWIVPDIGYIDFADSDYREWFIGAGYRTLVTDRVIIANEVYFVESAGPDSRGARYLQLWTGVFYDFTSKLGGEAVFFPYIPLNDSGRKQWVIERAKLEYTIISWMKSGAGYGAYRFDDKKWEHKPFVTVTVTPFSGKFGSLELWYQKLPEGKSQAQLRYKLVHINKKGGK